MSDMLSDYVLELEEQNPAPEPPSTMENIFGALGESISDPRVAAGLVALAVVESGGMLLPAARGLYSRLMSRGAARGAARRAESGLREGVDFRLLDEALEAQGVPSNMLITGKGTSRSLVGGQTNTFSNLVGSGARTPSRVSPGAITPGIPSRVSPGAITQGVSQGVSPAIGPATVLAGANLAYQGSEGLHGRRGGGTLTNFERQGDFGTSGDWQANFFNQPGELRESMRSIQRRIERKTNRGRRLSDAERLAQANPEHYARILQHYGTFTGEDSASALIEGLRASGLEPQDAARSLIENRERRHRTRGQGAEIVDGEMVIPSRRRFGRNR